MTTNILITETGLAATVAAKQGGMQMQITTVAFGDGLQAVSKTQTELNNELLRVDITDVQKVSNSQWHLSAFIEGEAEFACHEVGFFLNDGTLFAVHANPSAPIFYKSKNARIIQSFDLAISAVPLESIVVQKSSDFVLYHTEHFATLAKAQIDNMRRFLQMKLANN